jgi:hypothetical protein
MLDAVDCIVNEEAIFATDQSVHGRSKNEANNGGARCALRLEDMILPSLAMPARRAFVSVFVQRLREHQDSVLVTCQYAVPHTVSLALDLLVHIHTGRLLLLVV